MYKYKPLSSTASGTSGSHPSISVSVLGLIIIYVAGLILSVFFFWLADGRPSPRIGLTDTTYTYPENDIYKMIESLVYTNADIEYEVVADSKQEKLVEYKSLGDNISYKAYLHQRTYETIHMLDGLYDTLFGIGGEQ